MKNLEKLRKLTMRLTTLPRQDMLTAFIEYAADGIVVINDKGMIEFFNQGAERIFDRDYKDVLNKSLDILMPESFRKPHRQYVESYFKGNSRGLIGNRIEVPGLRSDGEELVLEITLSPGEIGGSKYVISIIRDVTDRVRAQKVLCEAMDVTNALIFELFVNNEICWYGDVDKALGVDIGGIPRSLDDFVNFVHHDDRAKFEFFIGSNVCEDPEPIDMCFQILHYSGKYLNWKTRFFPVRDVIHGLSDKKLVGVCMDITAKNKIQLYERRAISYSGRGVP